MTTELIVSQGHLPPEPAGWNAANLPRLYERAKETLSECDQVDECLEWSNRAAAFASYYRQAQDETLANLAQRIKLRAIRRCGQLFLESPSLEYKNNEIGKNRVVAYRRIGRMANDKFEEAVEASSPPSYTQLLERSSPTWRKKPESRRVWFMQLTFKNEEDLLEARHIITDTGIRDKAQVHIGSAHANHLSSFQRCWGIAKEDFLDKSSAD